MKSIAYDKNISAIVAIDREYGIGFENRLLCRLPDDLKYFKEKTFGHSIIMGRKTFESLGKPLPGRRNIILSKQLDFKVDGCLVYNSIPECLKNIPTEEEVFIIGGESIFKQTLEYCNKLYVTRIDASFQADSFFPKFDTIENWKEVMSCNKFHDIDEKHNYSFTFQVFKRLKTIKKSTSTSQFTIGL
ncbi:dihydrofolate reductase [Pedobacter vanadiisoli]|uniref:Dihydrofolate reductase n=1 Tax=Pedobacter vanadiisoli TaxID=1761975 RepID=A0ABW5ML13_9SPHI